MDLLVPYEVATADNFPALGMSYAASVDPVGVSRDEKLALVRVTLDQDPFTKAATDVIPALRENAKRFSPDAKVGGITADEFAGLNKSLHRLERFWTDQILYRL